MNGIINIFKPEGITSNGVINQIKRITGEKKIGHIGTLDPFAKGVLPLFLGKYTKLIPQFNVDEKTYLAVGKLGATSTTLDREGEIEEVPIPDTLDSTVIKNTLSSFLGSSTQVPPMYSAVKIKGKKLYEYAREGKTIERKSRDIVIHKIELLNFQPPHFSFLVHCSKGTYIRTLVDDIAIKMGTRAYLAELTRTKSGQFFNEDNAVDLEAAKKMEKSDLQRKFINPKYILFDWTEVKIHSKTLQKHISQGRSIIVPPEMICFSDQEKQFSKVYLIDQNEELLATGSLEFSQDSGSKFIPDKVFI